MSLLVRETADPVEPFSTQIREATRDDHERAERSPFVSAFLGGQVPRSGFAAMTGQLWFVYQALETAR